ncbi:uncharacterized protein [Cherax quadricarinatus]|uniref:uncharacterized protein isoform X2 n=1 Tax=Cherax quadricarinatus TaxID=27406 RepID=UPI00387ECE68
MAEGGGTQNVLCRYFINNVCNKGDQCRFSHDPAVAQPSMFCRYYLKGTCAYGDKCRYEHSVPDYVGKVYAPQSNAAAAVAAAAAAAAAAASNRPDGVISHYALKVSEESLAQSSQPNALSPSALILDAHRIPHNLTTYNNRKNMSVEDARSSARNLEIVVIKLGSTICRCMNCATPDVLIEFGNLLVNFWADAKEPCPNLPFTSDDLAQVVTSPDGRHFLEITLGQLQGLMTALKSLQN